ncbi:MAG TPA: hypothetical protein VLA34_01990 [Candidatus Krumholzibacterium sp.]|nr:hypothetical protein [Candidatus Krumholzibacterium sp.]
MRRIASMLVPVVALGILAGCAQREPVTILFTGDDQGRLVPSG